MKGKEIMKEIMNLINIIIDNMDFSPFIIDDHISNIVASKARTILNVNAPVYYEEFNKSTLLGRHSYYPTQNGALSVVQINECLSPSNIAYVFDKDKNTAIFYFERMCTSILHEYRHVYQRKNNMYSTEEYIDSDENYNGYRNQDCELDACEWASKEWKENGAQLLGAIFNFLKDLYLDLLKDN